MIRHKLKVVPMVSVLPSIQGIQQTSVPLEVTLVSVVCVTQLVSNWIPTVTFTHHQEEIVLILMVKGSSNTDGLKTLN